MAEIGIDVSYACSLLRAGKLVGVPTETVYGLACDAMNPDALRLLFKVKGRPTSHPVIVHLAHPSLIKNWVTSVPKELEAIAERFWPGPLTVILPKAPQVPYEVTGGQDTVAIRIPSHELTLALLQEFEGGLAAPSANKFGKLSPTRAQDVFDEFRDEIAYVLDGGACQVGIESTIVDLSKNVRVLRPGMITREELEECLGVSLEAPVSFAKKESLPEEDETQIRAPGLLKSHYSPNTPLKVIASDELDEAVLSYQTKNLRAAVLAFRPPSSSVGKWIVAEVEPEGYAKNLYSHLRELDRCSCDVILVEKVPVSQSWSGISDRLTRASCR